MSDEESRLGVCPECGWSLGREWLLIEYEKESGETGRFADCPECDAVVKPVRGGGDSGPRSAR
jgi:NAD-dependent SIR2 family protein deacetylase